MNRDRIVERAEKLAAAGKFEAAIRAYEELVRAHPNDVITLNRIGDLWARTGHNHSAVAVFKRIADIYLHDGFFLKAIAILKKVSRLEPNDLATYLRLADLYARQGLIVEARAQYSVVAESYTRRGQLVDALEAYRKSADLDEHDIDAATRVAELYAQVGRTDESDSAYRRIVLHALRRSGPAELLRVARSAMKHHPRGGAIGRWVGEILVEQKQLTLAITLLQEANALPDVEPETIVLLGRALVASGDLGQAREVFERGLERYPGHEHIRKNVAGLALLEGDSERALNLVGPSATHEEPEPALADDTFAVFEPLHDPDVLTEERLAEADVYASYGLSLPAVALVEQILAEYPDYPPALERLLRLALFDGRSEEASRIGTRLLPLLYRQGLREEVQRVEDALRRRDLLDSVLALVELPEMPPEPSTAKAEFAVVGPLPDVEIEIEEEIEDLHRGSPADASDVSEVAQPAAAAADAASGAEEGAIREQIDDIQRLIARRKITRATKLLEELLNEHPEEPELNQIRDGLRARKQGSAARRKTRPGTPIPSALKGELDEHDDLKVN